MSLQTVVLYDKMKRFLTVYFVVYFTGLWLAGHSTGLAWSGNAYNKAGCIIPAYNLSDTDPHGISGWLDIFDKGENEENVEEDTNFGKRLSGTPSFLVSLGATGKRLPTQTLYFFIHAVWSDSLIVLYHAWKFHL